MPPLPRRDYSIPRLAGPYIETGKVTPFPSIKRAALAIHNVVRHFFPTKDSYPVETSPTPTQLQWRPDPARDPSKPLPYLNPRWPRLPPIRGNPTILDVPGPIRKG